MSARAGAGAPAFDPGPVPSEHRQGAELFLTNCVGCHGQAGAGFAGGPPLLDTLYRRERLADSAVARAVLTGAPERHWTFGEMPAVRRVRPSEVPAIVGYLRWVQERWAADREAAPRGSVSPADAGE
jgi:mono/diheme cytochrome c family protein